MYHRLLKRKLKECFSRSINRLLNTIHPEQKVDSQSARPFKDIPGPKPLPIIGNIFRYLPIIGEFYNLSFSMQIEKMRKKFGDIVKLEGIIFRKPMVFLFKAELCEKMYRLEGPQPTRVTMETLVRYRKLRKDLFPVTTGLITSQGEDWYQFRSKVNQHMMQPRTIKPHVHQIDEVANDFIKKIRELRNQQTLELPSTFDNELHKWSLESIVAIALDHRMGNFNSNSDSQSESQKMIDAVIEIFTLTYELELLPSIWKFYETKKLKRLYHNFDIIYNISAKYISKAKEKLDKESPPSQDESILHKLLRIDEETARVMAIDMIMAGIDTTSNSAGMVLYYVANHPEVQKKLQAEVDSILTSKDSPITYEDLNKITYVKACIKESMRLAPITPGNIRRTVKEIVIGGYRIPKDVDVFPMHSFTSRDPRYFPQPEEFLPERWLRENTGYLSYKNAHPFASMPFGFGPRSCIGRRFAELEITTLLVKIVRNFKMEWNHEPMQINNRILNVLASPLQLKLIDR